MALRIRAKVPEIEAIGDARRRRRDRAVWRHGGPAVAEKSAAFLVIKIGGAELLSIAHCREHVAEFPQGLAEPDGAS